MEPIFLQGDGGGSLLYMRKMVNGTKFYVFGFDFRTNVGDFFCA